METPEEINPIEEETAASASVEEETADSDSTPASESVSEPIVEEPIKAAAEPAADTPEESSDTSAVSEEAESTAPRDLAQLLDEHDYDTPTVGDIRDGIVVSISNQGIIVDLGLKRDGLVQTSDIEELGDDERDELKLNDEVPVYIMETSHPEYLLVSIQKARLNQDWIRAQEYLSSGDMLEAPVIGYNRGGVIVPFGNLRGFVPASHLIELRRGMDDRQRQQLMSRMRDENLPLKVIEVDRRRRRLVLSQRDAQKEWQEGRKKELIESLTKGDVLPGRVSGLRSFGAFVDLGGADGLVHISELAWHRVNHPREVVDIGDEIEVYILGLDKEEQRIALSRKRLLPNPWSLAEDNYAIDQLVEGKITRIVNYGAFVEIEPGIEGLLHISQLSRDTIEDPHEVISEQEIHLLRVISLDSTRQRIGLSLRSVTANEQIEWMSQREIEAEEEIEEEAEIIEDDLVDQSVETSQELEIQSVINEAEETIPVDQQMAAITSDEEE